MRNHRAWIVKSKFIRILELVGGLYSTCFRFMVYIPPISNKLDLTNMVLIASKTLVLKQQVARSSLFLRSVPMTCSFYCFHGQLYCYYIIYCFVLQSQTVSREIHDHGLSNKAQVAEFCYLQMPHHAALRTSFWKLSGLVNLAKNKIFIRHWKTLKLYPKENQRESDCLSSRRERRGKKNTVESAVSLATTYRRK